MNGHSDASEHASVTVGVNVSNCAGATNRAGTTVSHASMSAAASTTTATTTVFHAPGTKSVFVYTHICQLFDKTFSSKTL